MTITQEQLNDLKHEMLSSITTRELQALQEYQESIPEIKAMMDAWIIPSTKELNLMDYDLNYVLSLIK